MTTEQFTNLEFTEFIEGYIDRTAGALEWASKFEQGEWVYYILVSEKRNAAIKIRSSIGGDGIAADTGQNSIRLVLVNRDNKPISKLPNCWVTRQPNWEDRLTKQIDRLLARHQEAGYCYKCKRPKSIWIVKKEDSEYLGRLFANCFECKTGWTLLEEELK